MSLTISEPQSGFVVFWSKGFRPFFLAATAFAFVAMFVWSWALFFGLTLHTGVLSYFQWHAHELLFGYGGAVLAGFLLTAAVNWTGHNTLSGPGLMLLVAVWLVARVGWLMGGPGLWYAGVADGAFWLILMVAIARPIFIAKQWRQVGILAKLLLLFGAHLLFFLDALALLPGAAYGAIYAALFTLVGLILVMLRRIFPFFVKAASDGEVELVNPSWIDRASLILFVTLFLVVILRPDSPLAPAVSAAAGLVLLVRLLNWYHPFIWQAPLLWSLYLGLGFVVIGCWMLAWSYWFVELRYLAVHAWAYGAFGLTSMGMVVRVAIGHSGNNVRAQRPWVFWVFVCLTVGAVLRVFMPLIWPQNPSVLLLSQVAWMLAYGICFYHLAVLFMQRQTLGPR